MTDRPRVVFVGAGAGDGARCSERGLRELAGARYVMVESIARSALPSLESAVVDVVDVGDPRVGAQRGQRLDSMVRVVADPLHRARVEIDALLASGVEVLLIPGIDMRPLAGRHILVTRAAEQASALAAMLEARGALPVVSPVIELHPPPDLALMAAAAHALASSQYDWVAFTSANAVERFVLELRRLGKDARAFGRARIGAIGPGTAAALERASLRADRMAPEFRGEGLAQAILEAAAPGERVLLPRALVARDILPETLRAAGLEVDVVPVYETRPPSSAAFGPALEGLDAVTLTSSSTASHLVSLLGPKAIDLLAAVTIASIGPITTQTAEDLGLRVAVTASPHTLPALVQALEEHFEKLRAPAT